MTRAVKHLYLAALTAALIITTASAQQEGPTPTQALVVVDAKNPVTPTPSNITLNVNDRTTPLLSIAPVLPSGAQVAILIDDGLRQSVGSQLGDLKHFVQSLPPGTEIFIGYMQSGRVLPARKGVDFTTDYAAAANSIRVPLGSAGVSASPYFCLSDFVKRWPTAESNSDPSYTQSAPTHKARFVLMITNGVDPYNGSTNITNQDSPYVEAASRDAQRAGIPIYSIYYSDAGIRGGQASFSGQGYLAQVADATGGRAYYEGTGNPVSMAPFLTQFQRSIAESYVATFTAPGNKSLVRLKLATKLPHTKLRAQDQVRPGTRLTAR